MSFPSTPLSSMKLSTEGGVYKLNPWINLILFSNISTILPEAKCDSYKFCHDTRLCKTVATELSFVWLLFKDVKCIKNNTC
jgi:hypothetical protein